MKFFLLYYSNLEVFRRFENAFADAWYKAGLEVDLVQNADITPAMIGHPDCLGVAGGQLYLLTLPRDLVKGKYMVNVSNRLGPDPRALNMLVDDEEIGTLAATHLLSKGYRRLVVLEQKGFNFSSTRSRAFQRVARAAGATVERYEINFFHDSDFRKNDDLILQGLRAFTNTLPGPLGVFGVSDLAAVRFLHAVSPGERRLHAVVGVDDIQDSDRLKGSLPFPLSSIHPPFEEVGRQAAARVVNAIQSGDWKTETVLVPGATLMERESSIRPANHDPLVHRAIDQIEQELSEGRVCRVGEMAEVLKVSEKTLYNRFHAAIGISAGDYILQRRLYAAADLLSCTDRPVTDIALDLGFNPPGALTRAFKKHFGQTPLHYRKRRSLSGSQEAGL